MKRSTAVWCVWLGLFVVATNRYANPIPDADAYRNGMGDAISYLAIADAAPGLPTMAMPFHHAQRYTVPYLIGLLHDAVRAPVHWVFLATVIVIAIGIVVVVARTLEDLGLSTKQVPIVLSVLCLNPWVFRSYLAFPEMVNDIAFMLGLALLLRGLMTRNDLLLVVGQIVASASRQTGLLLIPLVVLWLWLGAGGWKHVAPHRRIVIGVGLAAIAALVYWVTSHVAARFAGRNANIDHLIAGYGWLRSSFRGRALIKFMLMAAESPFLTIALLLLFVRRRGESATVCAILAVGSLCIWAQPVLGGPDVTGGSVQRLMTIGSLPVLLAAALAMRDARAFAGDGGANLRYGLIGLLGVASLHQMYVAEWMPIVGHHTIHAMLYSAACISALSIIVAEAVRARKRSMSAQAA